MGISVEDLPLTSQLVHSKMGRTTLLAFGLVVLATIQINAVPAPVIPATGVGKCVVPTPLPVPKPLSTHTLAEYVQAAKDLKAHFEKGGRDLEAHGNGEQCLPNLVPGAIDPAFTPALGLSPIYPYRPVYPNSYIEGYVGFANALNTNRGKGAIVKGKGKGKPGKPDPFINKEDSPARVILMIKPDGTIGDTWYYTIGHYLPGTWSGGYSTTTWAKIP